MLACSDPSPKDSPPARQSSEPRRDAGTSLDPDPEPDPAPPGEIDPTPSFHLDPDPDSSESPSVARRHRPRPIELILRSTPPGATASVDGRPVGKTPTYWAGTTDGRPREVTFALPGYAVARYRFVATHSGVVHGTMRRLTKPAAKGSPGESGEPDGP